MNFTAYGCGEGLDLTLRVDETSRTSRKVIVLHKWEGVDLAVLAAFFQLVEDKQIKVLVRSAPTGAYTRRLWYLHEWLTARQLDIPDPGKARAMPVVDPEQQFAVTDSTPSARHKVIDNLLGMRAFCPMVRRGEKA